MKFTYLFCPIAGCAYRTVASSPQDQMARRALAAHLQRKKHRQLATRARELACSASFGSPEAERPEVLRHG